MTAHRDAVVGHLVQAQDEESVGEGGQDDEDDPREPPNLPYDGVDDLH